MAEKCYSELLKYNSYDERLDYLWLGDQERDSPRAISNAFYKSPAWLNFRPTIIARDFASDMGLMQVPIKDRILIHHINPITRYDLDEWNVDILLNPENVITVSYTTHNIIHYRLKRKEPYIERVPGDTDFGMLVPKL